MKNKIRVLNYENAGKGIKLCLDNAKGLIKDAEILRDNQRYRGSVIFALFAWEECVKIEQIFNLLEPINGDKAEEKWKNFKKKYRSHSAKLISGFTHKIIDDIEKTGGKNVEKYIMNKKSIEGTPDLVTLKEACLYVNCDFNKKKFVAPYLITKNMPSGIIDDVRLQLENYRQFDNSNIEEIEKALKKYAGDEYWEKRPFEESSKKIKDRIKKIELKAKG